VTENRLEDRSSQ